MHMRRPHFGVSVVLLLVAAAPVRSDATFRTPNFIVHAPTQQVAQQFGQMAEIYRKQKAIEWLGQEMPNWPRPQPTLPRTRRQNNVVGRCCRAAQTGNFETTEAQ